MKRGIESGEAFRMKAFQDPGGLPASPAGRLACIMEWLAGPEIVDEDGEPTGERGEPLITKETALRLLRAVDSGP